VPVAPKNLRIELRFTKERKAPGIPFICKVLKNVGVAVGMDLIFFYFSKIHGRD
jgi:hypothetical protein